MPHGLRSRPLLRPPLAARLRAALVLMLAMVLSAPFAAAHAMATAVAELSSGAMHGMHLRHTDACMGRSGQTVMADAHTDHGVPIEQPGHSAAGAQMPASDVPDPGVGCPCCTTDACACAMACHAFSLVAAVLIVPPAPAVRSVWAYAPLSPPAAARIPPLRPPIA